MINGVRIMKPLVHDISAERVREFDVVGKSGASILGIIIQEEEDGTLQPQMLTQSQLSHVAIAIKKDFSLRWFEFAAKGGAFSLLSKYLHADEKEGLVLLRSVAGFTDLQKESMRWKVDALEGLPYDATGLVGKLLHLFFRRRVLKKNPLSGSGYFCSAGVEFIYRAAGMRITEYDDVRLNEPKDFLLTDKLERVL